MPQVNTLIITGPVADRSRVPANVSSRREPQVIRNSDGTTFTGRAFVYNFDLNKIVSQPAGLEDTGDWRTWRQENWGTPYNAPYGAAVSVLMEAERYTYSIPIDGVLSRKILQTLAENFITLRFELKVGEHSVCTFDRGVIVGEYIRHEPYDETCHECGRHYDDCNCGCDDDGAGEDERSDDPLEN